MKFCNQEVLKRIDEYIYENKERVLEDLLTLVRIPSVQEKAKKGNAFWRILCKNTGRDHRHV